MGWARNPYVPTWTQWCQRCYSENTITKGVTHICAGCGDVLYRSNGDAKSAIRSGIIHQAAVTIESEA